VGTGKVPDSLRVAVKNISGVGNPQGEGREKRTDWAKDLDIKTFTKGTEVLYFPCCYVAYDSQFQRVARATVNILKKVGVNFGILGAEVSCCGESVRKAGSEFVIDVDVVIVALGTTPQNPLIAVSNASASMKLHSG